MKHFEELLGQLEARVQAMDDALVILFQGVKDAEERKIMAGVLYTFTHGSKDHSALEHVKLATLERYANALGYNIEADPTEPQE